MGGWGGVGNRHRLCWGWGGSGKKQLSAKGLAVKHFSRVCHHGIKALTHRHRSLLIDSTLLTLFQTQSENFHSPTVLGPPSHIKLSVFFLCVCVCSNKSLFTHTHTTPDIGPDLPAKLSIFLIQFYYILEIHTKGHMKTQIMTNS